MGTDEAHPIRVVARRTGLSPHVIRVWERRYHAVTPLRNPTNRRLFSDRDVERLRLLKQAILGGRSICQVAQLATEVLQAIVFQDDLGATRNPPRPEDPVSQQLLAASLEAVEMLDGEALERLLMRARLDLNQCAVIDRLIVPLMEQVGEMWEAGRIRPVHEHLATVVIRNFLARIERAYQPQAAAPRIVVSTPVGQLHEIGALIVAATAGSQGWRVLYLGPNLAAAEIETAAKCCAVRAVALSIVYPCDDPGLPAELEALRAGIPATISILVGGRGSEAYRSALDRVGAQSIRDLTQLRQRLEELRA